VVGPAGPTTTNSTAITTLRRLNQRLLLQLLSSWGWAWGRPKRAELYVTSSNKLQRLLHLVGWFIWIAWWCTALQTLNLTLQHLSAVHSPFLSLLSMSNFFSVLIGCHWFFTQIALGDVVLCFSLMLVRNSNAVEEETKVSTWLLCPT
jgi:hypothetical protein